MQEFQFCHWLLYSGGISFFVDDVALGVRAWLGLFGLIEFGLDLSENNAAKEVR